MGKPNDFVAFYMRVRSFWPDSVTQEWRQIELSAAGDVMIPQVLKQCLVGA
jgi:hypothetical protein